MPRYVPLLTLAVACGSSSPSPVASPVASSPSVAAPVVSPTAVLSTGGEIGLAFSGAFVLDVAREGAECQTSDADGATYVGYSARNGVREPSWWLTVIDDDAEGPHQPSVVLNLGARSFTWRRDGGVVSAGAALDVARLDVALRGVGTPGVVHVKGTLSCP